MKSILAIQLKRIGDTVLTTPALQTLRNAYPDAKITLLLSAACRDLIPALPMVDKVLVHNPQGWNFGFWTSILFSRFDLSLDFTGTDRSAAVSVLSFSRKRIGFQRIGKPFAYTELVESSIRERHTVDHYLDLVAACGSSASTSALSLILPDCAKQNAARLLGEAGVRAPYVVLHPGSAREEKYWNSERWAAIADFCHTQYGLGIVLTGGRDFYEQAHLAALRASIQCPVVDLSGRSDLLTLIALIDGAKLLLGVDSAAMHFAAAMNTPLVALFGVTNPYHWHPRRENARVLMAGDPVGKLTPHHKKASMDTLTVERVIEAVESLFLKEKSEGIERF